ncbi:MAG: hypothetical protein ACPGLV_01855 [Bacteroidia bacterium]
MQKIFLNKESFLRPIWIILSVFFVFSLRTNRWNNWLEGLIGSKIADDKYYLELITHFSIGQPEIVKAPFGYRILIPFLASKFPFSPETALNILNFLALLATVFVMARCFKHLAKNALLYNSLITLFIFSFPTAYYSSIGYLDIWVVFMASIIAYLAIFNKGIIWYLVVFAVGVFIKESVIVLLPFVIAHQLSKKPLKGTPKIYQTILFSVVSFLIWLIAYKINRNISPVENIDFLWRPKWRIIYENLSRPRLVPALILSLGVQGFWFAYSLIKKRISIYSVWSIGFFSFFGLWIVAITSAYADGRFIWPAMIF